MIVSHHDYVMIAGETLTVIGKKVMAAAAGKSAAVHINHDWAFMRAIDLRCPKIEAQAILAWDRGSRATMQHELIFVGGRKVFPVGIEGRRVLVRANASILRRVANPTPRFGLDWRHEAPSTRRGGAIRYAFENVHTVPPEAADFAAGCFCDRHCVRRGDRATFPACCRVLFSEALPAWDALWKLGVR